MANHDELIRRVCVLQLTVIWLSMVNSSPVCVAVNCYIANPDEHQLSYS